MRLIPYRSRRITDPLTSVDPLGSMIRRAFRDMWDIEPGEDRAAAYPVDIREEDGTILVDAEVPGFTRDEIAIDVEDGMLRIAAERAPQQTKGTTHVNERRWLRVERRFTLPSSVDLDAAKATLRDGVLHLELPKTEEKRPRRLEIK